VAAPLLKVKPTQSLFDSLSESAQDAEAALGSLNTPKVHQTLSAFGSVVSSTVPGILHRAGVARLGIRRFAALR
jgi:hypothetical protein